MRRSAHGDPVMRRLAFAFGLVAFSFAIHSAQAAVLVNIDKSRQRMTVSVDGRPLHRFVVSTGRAGFGTPNGTYHPERLARTWFSRKYYNSPMPHSIFFHGGFAIHGSYEISRLGGPASHGCVRLHPADAATLYALVQREGTGSTTIVVSGTNPTATAALSPRPRRAYQAAAEPYQRPVYYYERPVYYYYQPGYYYYWTR
jgi:hypothetical protein